MPLMDNALHRLSDVLAAAGDESDATGAWPADALRAFHDAGGDRWAVPEAYGGDGLTPVEQIRVYMALGRGDVSTALIVTQRDGAVDLIAGGDNEALKKELLPRYARGEGWTTVGIAQLTTSRQGGEPAMRVSLDGSDVVFDGLMPWATGADHADTIVTGGVLDGGEQVLACVRTDTPGLTVEEPVSLMALTSSRTSAVRCEQVRVATDRLIRGPRPEVLSRRSPVKNWVTSSVGLGLATAMIDEIEQRRDRTPSPLVDLGRRLAGHVEQLRETLLANVDRDDEIEKDEVHVMRVRVNDLLVRLSGVMMLVVKGSGYLAGHRAQRLAREALFFCVWSAPDNIRLGTAERLATGIFDA